MTSIILVVDDEPDLETLVQQKFRRQIRDGEVRFLFARDGAEALDIVMACDTVDMVVSDINMPRMDGLICCRRYKRPMTSSRRSSCRLMGTWPIYAPR